MYKYKYKKEGKKMITTKKINSSKHYTEIINNIFKLNQVATEDNLSEKTITALNHSWKTGIAVSIFLDPINKKLLISNKSRRTFDKEANKYRFLGEYIFLDYLSLQNSRKNKLLQNYISSGEAIDIPKSRIKEFLESTNFKRKLLTAVDNLLKEDLLRPETEYISDLYNLRILFSEATIAQKVFAYYMEKQYVYNKESFYENLYKIPNDPDELLIAKNEIINILISSKQIKRYDPFNFIVWFNKTFTDINTDTISDMFNLVNKLFEKQNINSIITRDWIFSEFIYILDKITRDNLNIFQNTQLSSYDKNVCLSNFSFYEIECMLKKTYKNNEGLNLFIRDYFIFDFNIFNGIIEEFTGDYVPFYIDKLVDIDPSERVKDTFKLTIIPENVTDIYILKKQYENFVTIISLLNLEETYYIPEKTKIHFIEDDTSILDRFIKKDQ